MYSITALHYLRYLTVQEIYTRAENTDSHGNMGTPNTAKAIKTIEFKSNCRVLTPPQFLFFTATRYGSQRNSPLSRGHESHQKNRPSSDLWQTRFGGHVHDLQSGRLEVHKFRSYHEFLGYLPVNLCPESQVSPQEVSKHRQRSFKTYSMNTVITSGRRRIVLSYIHCGVNTFLLIYFRNLLISRGLGTQPCIHEGPDRQRSCAACVILCPHWCEQRIGIFHELWVVMLLISNVWYNHLGFRANNSLDRRPLPSSNI